MDCLKAPSPAGGRVTLCQGESDSDYPLFGEDFDDAFGDAPRRDVKSRQAVSSATMGSLRQLSIHESALATLFLSELNLHALQDGLRYRVNRASLDAGAAPPGYIIGRQNERELGIIMRGVYQQHGRNLPTQVPEQVRELNAKVLNFVVPRVLQEVMAYKQYRVDISTPRHIMPHGQIAGTKGDKQLGLRPT